MVDPFADTAFHPGPPPPRGPRLERIGPYVLERLLGQGGMGAVYVGLDPRLGRRLAVKVMLADHSGPEAARRFVVEAEASARLNHPAIVRVHDAGEERGRRYIAMDLVDGESLQARLERAGPLDAREAATIARRLADALSHAHEAGVLHRDLKPHNVLLSAPGTPVLTDFGLARQTGDDPVTRTGDSLGTPAYMPPEQIDDLKRVDARADVYGLGATLYAMLTGRPPFSGATALKIITLVLRGDPQPPRALRPDLDPDLEAVCLRCLEKDPARRYPTARALEAELGRWLAGEPVLGRRPEVWRRLTRVASPAQWLALGAAALVLVGGVLVAARLAPSPSLREPPTLAPAPTGADLLARGDVAAAISAFGEALRAEPSDVGALAGRADALLRLTMPDLRAAREDLERAVGIAPDRPDLLRERGSVRRRLGDLAGAVEDLRRARALGLVDAATTAELVACHLLDAVAADRVNDLPGVIAACASASLLDPTCASALAMSASAAWRAAPEADPADAIAAIDAAGRLAPTCARVPFERARVLLESANLDLADEPADRAVELATALEERAEADPGLVVVDTTVAHAHYLRAHVRESHALSWATDAPSRTQALLLTALEDADAAARLDPTWPLVHALRVRLLRSLGRRADALAALEDYVALAPGDVTAATRLDALRRETEEPPRPALTDEAPARPRPAMMVALQPELDVAPGSREAAILAQLEAHAPAGKGELLTRAVLRARTGDAPGALMDLEAALAASDLAPTERQAVQRKRAQLQALCDETLGAPGDLRACALFDRAQATLVHRRPEAALALVNEALAGRPRFVTAIRLQATCLQALRRWPEALAAVDRAVALAPGDPTTLLHRAGVREQSGDLAGAADDLETFAGRTSDERAAARARSSAARLRAGLATD